MKKPTQCERVIKYIKDFGSITTFQAMFDLGCASLSRRIVDLRRQGYDIRSEYVAGKNRYNEPVSYKKYYLGGMECETTQTGA